MPSNYKYEHFRQMGFSLVEILVGLVIGLLATMVIMQVFAVFEGQKRSTTGNADAQTNGSIALYNIKRDIEMAGYGLPIFSTTDSPLRCTTLPLFDHDGDGATATINMFPIALTDGGAAAGASDTIAIRYGRTQTGGIPIAFSVAAVTPTVATVDNNMACQAGDWAIISSGTNCAMVQVAATLLPLATRADWVQIPLTNAPAFVAGNIACIGQYQKDPPYDDHSSPIQYLYRVVNGALELNTSPSVAGIVNIQAQYGIVSAAAATSPSTTDDNQITQWVNATGGTWATPSVTDRNRIRAIRIAVVARNGLLEKENVTNACSSTTTANPTGLCAWEGSGGSPAPAIDLSNDPDWQRYRYRVFETIIPLRSMIWSA